MRRKTALAATLLALLGLAGGPVAAARLEGIAVIEGDSGTRAVLELTDSAEYKVFTLTNPDRLVLDLSGTQLDGQYKAPAPNGVVAGVRTGTPAEGDLRVVMDLSRAVKPRTRIETVGGEHRLVVELLGGTPAGSGAVAATATPAPARTLADVVGTGERELIVAIDAGHGGKDP